MFKRSLVGFTMLLFVAAIVLAHGAPLIGTVKEVGKDSFTIKDKAGKSTVVMMESTTKYLKDKKAASMSDIQVGTRVVIDAHQDAKTKKYAAEEVQIGVTATDSKSDANSQKAAPSTKKK